MEAQIRERLTAALLPERLEIFNESAQHAGHHSSPGTGESHFRVLIVSARFEGLSRIERHRLINQTLADQLARGVHALSIKAFAPGEFS